MGLLFGRPVALRSRAAFVFFFFSSRILPRAHHYNTDVSVRDSSDRDFIRLHRRFELVKGTSSTDVTAISGARRVIINIFLFTASFYNLYCNT